MARPAAALAAGGTARVKSGLRPDMRPWERECQSQSEPLGREERPSEFLDALNAMGLHHALGSLRAGHTNSEPPRTRPTAGIRE